MAEGITEKKSFDFAVRIVKLCRYLNEKKREYIISRQLLRAGTSIGANVAEAQHGQSKPDFISKMSIALKEANESFYWIKLLHSTDYITDKQFESLCLDINELLRLLTSIVKSARGTVHSGQCTVDSAQNTKER